MSNEAFGRNISEGLLSRLQNARHQLFVRTEGIPEPQLLSVSLPSSSDQLGFCRSVGNHCLRIESIENDSAFGWWNAQHADQQIRVGDCIVRVDSHFGEAAVLETSLAGVECAEMNFPLVSSLEHSATKDRHTKTCKFLCVSTSSSLFRWETIQSVGMWNG